MYAQFDARARAAAFWAERYPVLFGLADPKALLNQTSACV
jgi:hypothetical protein